MDEPTPDELDEWIAIEAEERQREVCKLELLYRLAGLPADDPLWDEVAERLEQRRL